MHTIPGGPPHAVPPDGSGFVEQIVDYAIVALDVDGTVHSWNAGAQRLKGYRAEEILGRNFAAFYTPDDRDAGLPRSLLDRARAQGSVEHTGWRVRKDGTRFWGDVVITALHDTDGTLTGYVKVVRDLTERHALELALRESEARFRLLVSEVVDYAIIALDVDGTVRSWNAGAETLKGYRADEVLGQHFSVFYGADDRAAGVPAELLQEARTRGRVEHTGWRVRKDGTRFWGDVVITALHDDTRALTGYAKVTRDLTEQHRLDQARASLFATVSHDLRSPVTTIGAYAGLIADADHATRAEYAERITENAERLEQLVTGLFDYAQLAAPSARVSPRLLPLEPFLRVRVADNTVALDGLQVRVDVAADLVAIAEPSALARVIDNLLSNAARYSNPTTTVMLTTEADDDRVRIRVTDQGRGIDPDDLPTIFDEFVRGRMAGDDGGTGLGLASVRDLVARQNGRVWIDSEVGVGTTVTVDLPRAHPAAEG